MDQMPPQAQAPQGPPQGQPQPKGEGASPSQIAQSVFTGLMKLTELAGEAGIPEELVQELGAIAQAFETVMDKLAGGGGEPQAPQGPRGPSAGGPGAVPVQA